MRSLRFGLSADWALAASDGYLQEIHLEPLPTTSTSMHAYKYTLTTLLDGQQRSVVDLVQRVRREYLKTESQVLAERLKDSTWQDVYTKIQQDALRCFPGAACKERRRAKTLLEAGTGARGERRERAKDQLTNVNLWCMRVSQGLNRLQHYLGDYFSCLWVIRVLLGDLEKSYTKRVNRGLVGPELIEELASEAHKMMVSLCRHFGHQTRLT